MGGKSSKSTQSVSIPPEVLARYNSVNAQAQQVAATPFRQYSTNANDFVAPLNSTQLAGIAGTNAAANQAQPYYGLAAGALGSAQSAANDYYGAATNQVGQAQDVGSNLANQAYNALGQGSQAANNLNQQAYGNYGQAYNTAQGANNVAGGLYAQGLGQAQGYNSASTNTLGQASSIGNALAGQSYNTLGQGQQIGDALNQQAYQGYNSAYNQAQPYNSAATGQVYSGLGQAQGYNSASTNTLGQASSVGANLGSQAYNAYSSAANSATPFNSAANQSYNSAATNSQPYNQSATNQYYQGLGAASGMNQAANQNIGAASNVGNALNAQSYNSLGNAANAANPLNQSAGQNYNQSLTSAQPYNAGATASYLQGAQSSSPLFQQSGNTASQALQGAQGYNQAATGALGQASTASTGLNSTAAQNLSSGLQSGQGYNQAATTLGLGGAQAVNAQDLNIDKYLSPYIQNVLQGTAGMLNQQNQSAMSGQLGNAIKSGGFGGDRAGIAAANLAQQQRTSDAQTFSNILNQGFTQALGTAQQQQGVTLGADQANRAALAAASQNIANIGQQGYNQNLGTAQAQAALGNQQYNQNLGISQQAQSLGNQIYNQGLTSAQQQQSLGQTLLNAGTTTGNNLSTLGNQQYNQALGAGQAQQSLGSQVYNQGANTASQIAALGNQAFNQGLSTSAAQSNLGNLAFNQASTTGQNLANVGNQIYSQNLGLGQAQQSLGNQIFSQGNVTGQNLAALGNQQYTQGANTASQLAALGNQAYTQGLGASSALQGIGNQTYNQGTSTAQAQAALGNQAFNQAATAAGQQAALGSQQYQQGANTASQLAALGNQAFNQNSTTGQNVAALGNQAYTQGMGFGSAQSALGNQIYNQGVNTSGQLSSLGNQQYTQGMTAAQQLAALGQNVYGTGAATSNALANLGSGAQQAALAGAQAQLAAGTTAQQTQQAGQTALYNQFLQQQSYPFQVAQFLANIATGTGSLSGSTTTTTQPGGFFSDKRLKEDIRAIGETYDGQKIYSYRYKGEPKTQIGLIAQEVEKEHPNAVGLAAGYKTIDYNKATSKAAKRGHFADGGVAGFDPQLMQMLLASQQGMYGLGAGNTPYNPAGMYGGLGIVPTGNLQAGKLETAGALPQQRTFEDNLASTANIADSVAKLRNDENVKKAIDWARGRLPNHDETGIDDENRTAQASGGAIAPYGQVGGLNIPTGDDDDEKELKTADSSGLKAPESGLDKVGKVASTAATILSFFSDKRLKEDIRAIGETYDGQKIYSYRYKGEPKTQIGLIAQEVEKEHPNAVGLAAGYKTIDYNKATSKAAKRGHFADGGVAPKKSRARMIIDASLGRKGSDESLVEEEKAKPQGLAPPPVVETKSSTPERVIAENKDNLPQDEAAKAVELAKKGNSIVANNNVQLPTNLKSIAELINKAEGTGKNPRSSARGKFQIVDGTFVGLFKEVHPERAKNMSRSQILALRNTSEGNALNEQLGQYYIQQNANTLQRNGIEPNAGNVYLAHFAGPQTAMKILNADPSTPVANIIGQAAVRANPSILAGKTAGQVAQWSNNLMARKARANGGIVEDIEPIELEKDKLPIIRQAKVLPVASYSVNANGQPVATPITRENVNPIVLPKQEFSSPNVGAALKVAQRAPAGQVQQLNRGEVLIPEQVEGRATLSERAKAFTSNPDNVISLLAGLSAMGTAPTRSLGVALATGIGAGAQTRQAIKQFNQTNAVDRAVAQAKQMEASASQVNATTSARTGNYQIYKNLLERWAAASANNPTSLQAQQLNAQLSNLEHQLGISDRNEELNRNITPTDMSKTLNYTSTQQLRETAARIASANPELAASLLTRADNLDTQAITTGARPTETGAIVPVAGANEVAANRSGAIAGSTAAATAPIQEAIHAANAATDTAQGQIRTSNDERIKANQSFIADSSENSAASDSVIHNVQNMRNALWDENGRQRTNTGVATPQLNAIASWMVQLGVSPEDANSFIHADPAANAILGKLQTQLGVQNEVATATGGQTRLAAVYQAFRDATPNTGMPARAVRELLDILETSAKANIKANNAISNLPNNYNGQLSTIYNQVRSSYLNPQRITRQQYNAAPSGFHYKDAQGRIREKP